METFILYLSKLNPKRNELWQRPKAAITDPINKPWYENQVVGRDPLNISMKLLSERAKLSRIYTNHCIRASVVTKLDQEGFEVRHIMVVNSHKSENSIKSYASKCPENKKEQMFDALAKPFAPTNIQLNTPTTPSKPEQSNVQNQLPTENATIPLDKHNFELVDLFPNMDEDIPDDNFLEAIQKIENKNQKLQPLTKTGNKENSNQIVLSPHGLAQHTAVTTTNSVTSNYIQNVHPAMTVPQMYFPHSNVTINYHFHN